MRMRSIAPSATLGLLLLGPAIAIAADTTSDVATAYAAWDAAFNKGDAKALAATYAADAKLLPPTHAVISGPAEIEKFFAGLFANGVTGHNLALIEAGGDGKVAFGAANWSARAKGADGASQDVGGIATHVFEQQADGSLKLKLHTFN
jgi:ketosteroid isomerase-like protein